jgi:hypothetical protein
MQTHDVFYLLDGFECHTQIPCDDSKQTATMLLGFIQWLRDQHATSRITPKTDSQPAAKTATNPKPTEDVCPEHGKSRTGLNGHKFCPTKLSDGSWCQWGKK